MNSLLEGQQDQAQAYSVAAKSKQSQAPAQVEAGDVPVVGSKGRTQ